MPSRRAVCIAASSLAVSRLGRAQPSGVRRIGSLSYGGESADVVRISHRMIAEALQRLGWKEGANIAIERRFAEGSLERLDTMAADLAQSGVEVILAPVNAPTAAALRATRTIPIVMIGATEPVERGFVQSLARPGGNVTGTAVEFVDLCRRALQIMREMAPDRRQVAMLEGPVLNPPIRERVRKDIRQAAEATGLRIDYFDITAPADVTGALERIAAIGADLMLVSISGALDMRVRDVTAFALRQRILAMGAYTLFASLGGAMYYGSNLQDIIERSMTLVDRILRGAKPAELPVELPTRFDLILNLRSLRQIGITPPRRILLQANELLE